MADVPAGRGQIPPSSTRECRNALITELGVGGVGEQVCCGPPPGTTPPPQSPQRERGTGMGTGTGGHEGRWRGRERQSLADLREFASADSPSPRDAANHHAGS